MSVLSRLQDWLRRLKSKWAPLNYTGLLREFVYLDDVSVYSILASRKGAIATEFTESQTVSLNSDVGTSVGIGLGETKATIDSKLQASDVKGSQVLRKAIIQTSFKDLYENERAALALSPPAADSMPVVKSIADIEKLDPDARGSWLVDPSEISRGELLEVEVELEADPIFRIASVIATLRGFIEDNEQLFGHSITGQIAQMKSIAQVLDSLLIGLVPVRGLLVDYESAHIGGRDVLIHRSLLEQIGPDIQVETHSAFVVGVAQRGLFWKDIRRVLFSKARYTVFCRLATEGLADSWQPVKVAGVLAGIVPQFDEAINAFGELAHRALTTASLGSQTLTGQHPHDNRQGLALYVDLLAERHCQTLSPGFTNRLFQEISPGRDSSVDSLRPIFDEVTRRVDTELGVETSNELVYELRDAVLGPASLRGNLARHAPSGNGRDQNPLLSRERFLDTEIVAIYW